mmetsp:Transcript_18611/g.53322  ORF Transcript_18611/g.53322 Transcript_18611/m.53322 type:complete len:585 (+) Transcript_18611:138-1892(+)
MIRYQVGYWGIGFLFQLAGSVFPKACAWAIPCTCMAVGLFAIKEETGYQDEESTAGTLLSVANAFITILGFMLVFRSNQAWTRYWEGADLVLQARGSWMSAASSLIAFCNRDDERFEEVRKFQNHLVRLMSLLFATALETLSDEEFDTLDLDGLDPDVLERRTASTEVNIELLIYWIQRTVVLASDSAIINIAPPILSRVFNELADGVVKISSSRKIRMLQFPFHYAQMLGAMLLVYSICVPAASAYLMRSWYGAASATFINVFTLWCLNYLAQEIEQPFGKEINDLPLEFFSKGMNNLQLMLLREGAMSPPQFDPSAALALRQTLSQVCEYEDDPESMVKSQTSMSMSFFRLGRKPSMKKTVSAPAGHRGNRAGKTGSMASLASEVVLEGDEYETEDSGRPMDAHGSAATARSEDFSPHVFPPPPDQDSQGARSLRQSCESLEGFPETLRQSGALCRAEEAPPDVPGPAAEPPARQQTPTTQHQQPVAPSPPPWRPPESPAPPGELAMLLRGGQEQREPSTPSEQTPSSYSCLPGAYDDGADLATPPLGRAKDRHFTLPAARLDQPQELRTERPKTALRGKWL